MGASASHRRHTDGRPAGAAYDATALPSLVARLRPIVTQGLTDERIAARVTKELSRSVPAAGDLLQPEQQVGRPDRYEQHVLHVERDSSFSIVALVWRPGQATPIHDHVSWCVVAVLEGTERETIYERHDHVVFPHVVAVRTHSNPAGTVCGFAPPGDIHAVENGGPGNAISLHVYGADIAALGTSIRRRYALPVFAQAARQQGSHEER